MVESRAVIRQSGVYFADFRLNTQLTYILQIAWPLIANFSCPQGALTCTKSQDMGYRYLLFTLGGFTLLLWGLRFFLFKLEESPRFLVGLGKDAEAVAVIQRIATFNGKECSLTVEDLQRAESEVVGDVKAGDGKRRSVLSASSDYTIGHDKALFKTKKLAWSTSLLIAI